MSDMDCGPRRTENVKKKELLRRIEALEDRLAAVESQQSWQRAWTTPIAWNAPTTTPPDCGCPVNTICNNYICPRAPRITS